MPLLFCVVTASLASRLDVCLHNVKANKATIIWANSLISFARNPRCVKFLEKLCRIRLLYAHPHPFLTNPLDLDRRKSGNGAVVFWGDTMPISIATRLASLPHFNKSALTELWNELFSTPAPRQLRRDFMIPILACRLQEEAFGTLDARVRARLHKLAAAYEKGSNSAKTGVLRLKAGTRLVREWRGEVHLVNVEANGYEYKGGRYKSLSEVARLITGTRWSGPLFFGINANQPNSTLKEAQ